MRKPIIAGNWKMNKTIAEAVEFVNEIKGKLNDESVDAVICAPFTILKDLKEVTKGTNIKVGAQNMHFADNGAFTGEVSPAMLKELDIDYVVSSSELECACKVGLNEICSEYGMYIYKMSEKNY